MSPIPNQVPLPPAHPQVAQHGSHVVRHTLLQQPLRQPGRAGSRHDEAAMGSGLKRVSASQRNGRDVLPGGRLHHTNDGNALRHRHPMRAAPPVEGRLHHAFKILRGSRAV